MRAFPTPLCVAVLAASMAGCATSGQYVEPQTPLDSAILLVESDDHGNKYTISADDGDGNVVTRVGRPALVDINSTIRIRILKATLAAGTTPNSAQLDTLRAAQRRLTAAMESLAETLEKRAAAVAGYEAFWTAAKVGRGDSSLALAHFLELRSEFETADSDFLELSARLFGEIPGI